MPEIVDVSKIERISDQAANIVALQPTIVDDPLLRHEILNPIDDLASQAFMRYCYKVLSSQCYGLNINGELDTLTGGSQTQFIGHYERVEFIDTSQESIFGGTKECTVPALIFGTLDFDIYDCSTAQTYLWVAVSLVGEAVDIELLPRIEY